MKINKKMMWFDATIPKRSGMFVGATSIVTKQTGLKDVMNLWY